jgi:hypothetical protein
MDDDIFGLMMEDLLNVYMQQMLSFSPVLWKYDKHDNNVMQSLRDFWPEKR